MTTYYEKCRKERPIRFWWERFKLRWELRFYRHTDKESKMISFETELDGEILATTTVKNPVCRHERKHLAKMNSGEWALVESWITTGDWGCDVRVFNVVNRIGSHPTVPQALERFDQFVKSSQ